jgi:hypothetical protein
VITSEVGATLEYLKFGIYGSFEENIFVLQSKNFKEMENINLWTAETYSFHETQLDMWNLCTLQTHLLGELACGINTDSMSLRRT